MLRTLQSLVPTALFSLKYPNDVLANVDGTNKKIAGILVQTEFRSQQMSACVCGIGVNINQKSEFHSLSLNTFDDILPYILWSRFT